jgi:hypothetical protein
MARRHRETFTTIKTEGNLLPIDLLQRIAEGDSDINGLTPDSFHLTKNERLNEAINRAWNRYESAWRGFQSESEILPESDAGTTITRERWLLTLFQELGYGRLLTAKSREIGGKTYPISHNWHHTPIHLVTFRQDLDRRTPGVAGAARMSPHSLVQEFLNRSEDQLWGIVSNGLKLRLLRDNASLTRQAYVEFDLEGMMSGEVYSDFILLFMLLHESRVEAESPEQCWLERWTQEAQKQGTRALDHLREGVEQAIKSFGQGFLAHPSNMSLRKKLQSGERTTHDLYQQRNASRFPADFMFQLDEEETTAMRSQIATSKEGRGGRRYLPYVFTEQGIAMLSSVLHSERAIQVNIAIMRVFVRLRELMLSHRELAHRLAELEHHVKYQDKQIQSIFDAIHRLVSIHKKPKKKIGFEVKEPPASYGKKGKKSQKKA